MTPDQFVLKIQKQTPAAAYLFIGPEPLQRDFCRKALLERVLQPDEIDDGFTRHDLDETPLASILDDARSFSLFTRNRVIWVSGAEGALPRRLTDKEDDGSGAAISDLLRHAPPGVTVVFDCSRFDFDGDDKAKLDRVQKFYSIIPDQVEFRPFTPESARRLAQETVRRLGLQLGISELGLLVDTLGADGARIVQEIEKLSLFAGKDRKITADDIQQLVPDAQATTMFALVSALGRGDRKKSLQALDTLMREGEYLPLALTFLATQFRLALVAQEAKLQNAQQIQTYFTRQGIRIWRERAEQVQQTLSAFPKDKLADALAKVFWADKSLRDVRPDDRVIMEELVLSLTR
ncbi:MAG: DNA polymerase III subunit delta [Acidobacteriaceae bacterium]|nr:DNA polymerase III subunit delta [Acidobacteriaceae bacterium]